MQKSLHVVDGEPSIGECQEKDGFIILRFEDFLDFAKRGIAAPPNEHRAFWIQHKEER